jgi:hypothetical protein
LSDVLNWAEEADLAGWNRGYQDQLLIRGGLASLRTGGIG